MLIIMMPEMNALNIIEKKTHTLGGETLKNDDKKNESAQI